MHWRRLLEAALACELAYIGVVFFTEAIAYYDVALTSRIDWKLRLNKNCVFSHRVCSELFIRSVLFCGHCGTVRLRIDYFTRIRFFLHSTEKSFWGFFYYLFWYIRYLELVIGHCEVNNFRATEFIGPNRRREYTRPWLRHLTRQSENLVEGQVATSHLSCFGFFNCMTSCLGLHVQLNCFDIYLFFCDSSSIFYFCRNSSLV